MERAGESLSSNRKKGFKVRKDDEDALLTTAIEAISEKKGSNIVSLDLRNIEEAVADYFVLCEVGSSLQMKAVCDNIEEKVWDHCDERSYHIQQGEGWTLIDYVNVVIHIFREEERKFYDLEGLWMDGARKDYD